MSEEEIYHEQLYQEYLKEEEYKEEYQKECSYIEYLEKQLKECKEFASTFVRELLAIIKFKGIEINKLQQENAQLKQQLKDKDEKISNKEELKKANLKAYVEFNDNLFSYYGIPIMKDPLKED